MVARDRSVAAVGFNHHIIAVGDEAIAYRADVAVNPGPQSSEQLTQDRLLARVRFRPLRMDVSVAFVFFGWTSFGNRQRRERHGSRRSLLQALVVALLGPHCNHGIDFGGAPRRQISRAHGHGREKQTHSGEG